MYHVPQFILEQLKCGICGGYLSSKPIMIKTNSEQVCGKCFNVLTAEEKNVCVQQIGLEAVADILVFPCRYHKAGCKFTFSVDKENDHEVVCPFQSLILTIQADNNLNNKSYNNITDTKMQFHSESSQLKTSFNFEVTESKYSQDYKHLKYNFIVQGHNGNSLLMRSKDNLMDENVQIFIDGALFLKNQMELLYNDMKVIKPSNQHIYDTLKHTTDKCTNCRVSLSTQEHHCLFGHLTCYACRGSMCILCVNQMSKDAKIPCKNISKGCREILSPLDMQRHEDSCEFNQINCPFHCQFSDVRHILIAHMHFDHPMQVYDQHEITKSLTSKDEVFVLVCYGSIFKCTYFYYKSFVEIFVTHIGPPNGTKHYLYEIAVQTYKRRITKRCKCANWNNFVLEKGIQFEKKDLMYENERKLNFEMILKIFHE